MTYYVTLEIYMPPQITTTPEPWEHVAFKSDVYNEAQCAAARLQNRLDKNTRPLVVELEYGTYMKLAYE